MTASPNSTATASPESTNRASTHKPKNFPLRKRTGTAAFHMSSAAVGLTADDIEKFTPKDSIMFAAEAAWGSKVEMPCPHCGTIDAHRWRNSDKRWKCKCCDSTFSVTSKTIFADVKLPLTKVLKLANDWTPAASGIPALQMRRKWGTAYLTMFTFCHKLREGLARGFNAGILAGTHEMDGMHANGKNYRGKRNRPIGSKKGASLPSGLMKQRADFIGPPLPPKFELTKNQPEDRRIILVLRQRGVAKGKGASASRVSIAITESADSVTAMAKRFASAESAIMSDDDNSYGAFSTLFKDHKSIKHTEAYSDLKGTNNNQAESLNKRLRRAVQGIYLCPSNKYLHEYATEQAWREDTRRMSPDDKLKNLLRTVLFVGPSRHWIGYSHGDHRTDEILIDGTKTAKARGKPKGWKTPIPR